MNTDGQWFGVRVVVLLLLVVCSSSDTPSSRLSAASPLCTDPSEAPALVKTSPPSHPEELVPDDGGEVLAERSVREEKIIQEEASARTQHSDELESESESAREQLSPQRAVRGGLASTDRSAEQAFEREAHMRTHASAELNAAPSSTYRTGDADTATPADGGHPHYQTHKVEPPPQPLQPLPQQQQQQQQARASATETQPPQSTPATLSYPLEDTLPLPAAEPRVTPPSDEHATEMGEAERHAKAALLSSPLGELSSSRMVDVTPHSEHAVQADSRDAQTREITTAEVGVDLSLPPSPAVVEVRGPADRADGESPNANTSYGEEQAANVPLVEHEQDAHPCTLPPSRAYSLQTSLEHHFSSVLSLS
jgi:hypothetical protein